MKKVKEPSFEERVEGVYAWAVDRWRNRRKTEESIAATYGPHASEVLAFHDDASEFIRKPIAAYLLLRPPEEVPEYFRQHAPKLPANLVVRRDTLFAALVPEDERWKVEGWSCRCGCARAIFMDTCTKRPDSFKVWCAECTRFVGLASEDEFIFALDHQRAIEVLEYFHVADLRRQAGPRAEGAGMYSETERGRIVPRVDPIDSEFPDLEAPELGSESSSK